MKAKISLTWKSMSVMSSGFEFIGFGFGFGLGFGPEI